MKVELNGSKELPRKLVFAWDRYGANSFHGYCHAFLGSRSIAYAGAHSETDIRLSYEGSNPVLWLGYAQFDLTASEAEEIERVFEPVGIRIVRKASAS